MNTYLPLCIEESGWWVHLHNSNHDELVSITLEPFLCSASNFSSEYRMYNSITLAKFETIQKFNPLSANFTKWPNTLKQFVGNLPTNCLSVLGHFVALALKGLRDCNGAWTHNHLVHKTNIELSNQTGEFSNMVDCFITN